MPLRRTLLFAASFFVALFCFGLLIGGDRLLATDLPTPPSHTESSASRLPEAPLTLCFLNDVQRASTAPLRCDTSQKAQRTQDRTAQTDSKLNSPNFPLCDANGNVLQRTRYMQAVYSAFALGDVGG